MHLGKSIRIYLADASVTGMRHGEIANWTGQAIACPRARIGELKQWPETGRPSVYFLIGVDDESGKEAVYVGEAEVVRDRLSTHLAGKDFWTEAVAFTSKDDNLTKGHAKYLESRLIAIVAEAGRFVSFNTVSPSLSSLPRADRDAMEEFLDGVRTLLGVLGHKALEPLVKAFKPPVSSDQSGGSKTDVSLVPTPVAVGTEFLLNVGQIKARAVRGDEGLVVLEGSEVALSTQPSLSSGYASLRARLVKDGVLVLDGSSYRFSAPFLFSSPSQAAAICVGYSINGRDAWRTESGVSLKQLEDGLAAISGASVDGL